MKNETKEIKGKGRGEVTIKLSGYTLRQILSVRGERENSTGQITSIAELVREAIDCWYDVEAEVKE